MTRNINVLTAAPTAASQSSVTPGQGSLQGIKCDDKTVRASSLEHFMPVVELAHQTSRTAGDANDIVNMERAQWKMSAKENYTGDFRVQTRLQCY